MSSITLQNISKQFGDTHVIQELNLSIVEGEFLTLVGPSGCGKSTLLRIIAGLEQQSRGHIFISDTPAENTRPSERDLAMVFQSYALYPHLTVYDNIAVPLRMRLLSSWQRLPIIHRFIPGSRELITKIHDQVMDVAKTLGLSELLDRKPGALSGGQRQRVAVGRAIIRKPKAFLFDEPLSNLDAKLRVHMRTEITELHQQLKTTFVYVTHDQVEAMTMSDRIAVMMKGEIVQIGTPTEVYHNPQDIRVAQFIGSPEINLIKGQRLSSGLIDVLGQKLDLSLNDLEPIDSQQDCEVHVGIRPENLFIVDEKPIPSSMQPALKIQCKVTLIENLGAEVFVHLYCSKNEHLTGESNNQRLIIRLTYDTSLHITLGQTLLIGFLTAALYIFGFDGKRIDINTKQKHGPVVTLEATSGITNA